MHGFLFGLLALIFSAPLVSAPISYQGQLKHQGEPHSDYADFQFKLFDSENDGEQIGTEIERPNWPVHDGLFQVELDFGPDAFDGSQRYLEIWVNDVRLSPRHEVTAAPVALFALDGNEGPEGPQGETGPPGPPGPSGLEGLVYHTENRVQETDNSVQSQDIVCPDDLQVISAGWRVIYLNPFSLYVHGSWPNTNNKSRWDFQFRYAGTGNNVANLELRALCAQTE